MMLALNFATGLVAVVLMMLVLKGSWQYIIARRHEHGRFKRLSEFGPGDLMRLGVGIWHLKGMLRTGYYDVVLLALHFSGIRETGRGPEVAFTNAWFAAMAGIGALIILAAFYYNIPEDQRKGYTWLTSPWHPAPPPGFFWRK